MDPANFAPKPKRSKRVKTLLEKVQILDKCREGLTYAAVGRMFEINESTVRHIKKQEDAIRKAVADGTPLGKYFYVNDRVMLQMEAALFAWIEEQKKNNVSVSSSMISTKAKELYYKIKGVKKASFNASKGWLYRFKKRYSLSSTKFGEEQENVAECTNTSSEEYQDQKMDIKIENEYEIHIKEEIIEDKPSTDEENLYSERKLDYENLIVVIQDAKRLATFFCDYDEDINRANEFKNKLEDALAPYYVLLEEFKKNVEYL